MACTHSGTRSWLCGIMWANTYVVVASASCRAACSTSQRTTVRVPPHSSSGSRAREPVLAIMVSVCACEGSGVPRCLPCCFGVIKSRCACCGPGKMLPKAGAELLAAARVAIPWLHCSAWWSKAVVCVDCRLCGPAVLLGGSACAPSVAVRNVCLDAQKLSIPGLLARATNATSVWSVCDVSALLCSRYSSVPDAAL